MWKNPLGATPSIIQVDFGAWGQNLPGDGEQYCCPTSMVMGLYWLSANGFTQLAPPAYHGQQDAAALNLVKVIAGLAGTSAAGGTTGSGTASGMADYLSACGIAPDQYTTAVTDTPDLSWLAAQLAANVASNPDSIVLANFSVGWYSRASGSTSFSNSGGHVLAPLIADPDAGTITLNNAYPAAFENVPNQPGSNPQTVAIAAVPAGWTLPDLGPSQDYTQIITPILGGNDVAILWGAQTWSIARGALPSTPGYAPRPWRIGQPRQINTNGGTLVVAAPLTGHGGIDKCGEGMLLLTAANDLTGTGSVSGGVLASSSATGTPFGAGPMTLSGGGTLLLGPAQPATLAIAAAAGATCSIGSGGGVLALLNTAACAVSIGGHTDGTTPNIARAAGATLTVAPGAGVAALGDGVRVTVAGSAGNLPATFNGIVAPCIVGADSDTANTGHFLTYDIALGFVAAATVSSATVGINQAPADAVYAVVDQQTIAANASVQLAAVAIDGGGIGGDGATLLVGSQAGGDLAGVIMNGGSISAAALAFGDAEALIYGGAASIAATIGGSAGLTMFGPGPLTLAADNAATLSGPVSVNAGILIAAAGTGSATGSGAVAVNAMAMLAVTGMVGGAVTVAPSGTLQLSGGTVQGDLTIAAIGASTAEPGGILAGGGSIAGTAVIGGTVQSGTASPLPPAQLILFQGDVTMAGGAAFVWRPQSLVDNSDSKPGVAWNALQFTSANSNIGTASEHIVFFLDFGALTAGDPDGGDPFWQASHSWDVFLFAANAGTCWWEYGNFEYASGSFGLAFIDWTVCLSWTPATTPQSPAMRRSAQARTRDGNPRP
jgi:hypothetical protein